MLAFLFMSAPLLAQAVSAGIRTGVGVSPFMSAQAGQRFTLGPHVEAHLWRRAGVGIDFLFQNPRFEVGPAHSRVTMWRVEAPVTFVYRFYGRARPFFRTGIAFNRVFDIKGATACARGPFGEQFYCIDGSPAAELRHRGTSGFVAGGGVGRKFGRLRIEPEVRVTHWFDRNFGVRDSAVRSNLNEAALLFGITF